MGRVTALLPVAVGVAVLSGCFGSNSLSANQERVCATLGDFVTFMEPMSPRTNPEGTMLQADFASTVGLERVTEARDVLNGPQEELLDRYERALQEYNSFAKSRPPEEPLTQTAAALNSYSLNLLLSYEDMLTRIGCPLPTIVEGLPRT